MATRPRLERVTLIVIVKALIVKDKTNECFMIPMLAKIEAF